MRPRLSLLALTPLPLTRHYLAGSPGPPTHTGSNSVTAPCVPDADFFGIRAPSG
jgi:hypothetical protein